MKTNIEQIKKLLGYTTPRKKQTFTPTHETDLCRIDESWAWCIVLTYRGLKKRGISTDKITNLQTMESYCKNHALPYSEFWGQYKNGIDEYEW